MPHIKTHQHTESTRQHKKEPRPCKVRVEFAKPAWSLQNPRAWSADTHVLWNYPDCSVCLRRRDGCSNDRLLKRTGSSVEFPSKPNNPSLDRVVPIEMCQEKPSILSLQTRQKKTKGKKQKKNRNSPRRSAQADPRDVRQRSYFRLAQERSLAQRR